MKKALTILFAIIGWLAIIGQYYLIIENRVAGIGETTIRFFSYFTILSNLLVAIYFTASIIEPTNGFFSKYNKPGLLTALTVYITIVGLVYQIVLRQHWKPTGLQIIIDELLHSVIPTLVIIYWYLFEHKSLLQYKQISNWLIYPIIYLCYILIRGHFSAFYPYPFVDVLKLGYSSVLINSGILIIFFSAISTIFIFIGRSLSIKTNSD